MHRILRLGSLFALLLAAPAPRLAAAELPSNPSDYWAPGWMHRDMWGESADAEIEARMKRHFAFMNGRIPEGYLLARSPLESTPKVIEGGRMLYDAQCATCHGRDGLGDGNSAKGLSPSPALLAYLIQTPIAVDSYLLWTVAEGGERFGTAMPAFKGTLRSKDIWKIVAFLRAGLPRENPAP